MRGRSTIKGLSARIRRCGAALALGCALALMPALASATEKQTLNHRDSDVRAFIDDVAMLTGRMFIVDPRVKGNVTVISHAPVDSREIFDIFLATLRVNGFTAVSMPSGAYKIVPNDQAAVSGSPVGTSDVPGDSIVTEVFKLQHIDGATAMNLVKPIVNKDGRIVSNRGSNMLIVVDYASNMSRIRSIVAQIDRDLSEIESIRLFNTSASEMARIVTNLRGGGEENRGASGGVTAIAVEGSNTVVLKGERDAVTRAAAFVRNLDETSRVERKVEVVTLKYARAEKLVPVLQEVSNAIIKKDENGQPLEQSGAVNISFHKATNALIINADQTMLNNLKQVIAQLDVARAQVLVEAIIVEVSDTAAKELGLQYVLSGTGDSAVPFSATNFSNSAPNILAATGAVVGTTDPDALDGEVVDQLQEAAINSLLGLSGFALGAGGQTKDGTIFGVILNALQQDVSSNVLSTPSIMTIENESASIIVGQEIPITTGERVGDNLDNPFRTVDRQNVGIQLEVTPQINPGDPGQGIRDTIKLDIRAEVSSIIGPVIADSTDLVLSKREVQTPVQAGDGDIIVIGGLISQDEQISLDKVPFLGDIPVIGRVFQSKSKSKEKRNLMVFLRPSIIRDPNSMRQATGQKWNLLREEQIRRSRNGTSSLDDLSSTVLNGGSPNFGEPGTGSN